jgi:hypothetical protein
VVGLQPTIAGHSLQAAVAVTIDRSVLVISIANHGMSVLDGSMFTDKDSWNYLQCGKEIAGNKYLVLTSDFSGVIFSRVSFSCQCLFSRSFLQPCLELASLLCLAKKSETGYV